MNGLIFNSKIKIQNLYDLKFIYFKNKYKISIKPLEFIYFQVFNIILNRNSNSNQKAINQNFLPKLLNEMLNL